MNLLQVLNDLSQKRELSLMKEDEDTKRKRKFLKQYKKLCHNHGFMLVLKALPEIMEYNIGDFHDMENEICKTL